MEYGFDVPKARRDVLLKLKALMTRIVLQTVIARIAIMIVLRHITNLSKYESSSAAELVTL